MDKNQLYYGDNLEGVAGAHRPRVSRSEPTLTRPSTASRTTTSCSRERTNGSVGLPNQGVRATPGAGQRASRTYQEMVEDGRAGVQDDGGLPPYYGRQRYAGLPVDDGAPAG